MKILRKDSDYAIRTLLTIAINKDKKFMSSSEISKTENIPLPYLRRLITKLISAGYLEAKEGVGGGVRLARKPSEINTMQIMELFQGNLEISECLFRKKFCTNRATCPMRKRILKIEEKLVKEFESITLKNLISDINKK
ncbi:MAG: Rrf2 family transcriptional regulator [Elusimicrobiaceae bacterium]|nr:Rrf2 family transcriptional regulator [Elusimicrobiaceae bacterium]MBT3954718.1 Rrf2 family transcriptional regulator [Elusimicrobiaceae bacterium]MBT4008626.1 Rrf2 family transcriptional regulator [Elusimicrobiaceae bacterium]MBT4402464.1 Rrf2 family transcriptional regulator [Elusimicrobiaceae bacterium]MBT4439396.1 Rrf2 family transcriptional regulator [Elusimicrobiaceae bacterium]